MVHSLCGEGGKARKMPTFSVETNELIYPLIMANNIVDITVPSWKNVTAPDSSKYTVCFELIEGVKEAN